MFEIVSSENTRHQGIRLFAGSASLILHAIAILTLSLLPDELRSISISSRQEIDEAVPASEKKVIWYRFKDLPPIPPPPDMTRAAQSQAPTFARPQTILSEVPPTLSKKLVWTSENTATPPPDITLPDLVQTAKIATPAPKPIRQFAPAAAPSGSKALPQDVVLLSPDGLNVDANTSANPKLPVSLGKKYIPPPPSQRSSLEPQMLAGTLNLSSGAVPVVTGVVINQAPILTYPVESVNGNRRGDVSSAPTEGRVAAGKSLGAAVGTVPGLAIEARTPPGVIGTPKATTTTASGETVYQTARLGVARQSLSVPLRAFARTVPPHIEAHFAGRDVYTMLLPMPDMAEYGSDWVLWFGEKTQNPIVGRIRAPLPKVKRASRGSESGSQPARVRAALSILPTGRISGVKILSISVSHAQQEAEEDLLSWEFTPATRDGLAIETDVLLDFTLRTHSQDSGPAR